MADVHTREVRSYNMSRIKNKNTALEMCVRKYLHALGFRYRVHVKELAGRPDIVLPKYNTVLFINGCFWHGHNNCQLFVVPKTDTKKWLDKINKNIENDRNALALLTAEGWKVVVVWECTLKPKLRETTLAGLARLIKENYR
ncbi:DNA mismatch endonuclease (patch repair protein) [Chitinophaga dinghuensis]|uniref:Very short patch repair endonuclease n=1 Tax=Chitinophaga dinghuensis TaxID=1539050 RepID=A0A327W6G9_9BACT|nr:DNA mismatch endonuclease Vsr [Chitinophaga dinghuensis]RAJ83614.1 DNA mismatch endonuclease (patch repair protein) [Chitinophaga dinghuensis]